VIREILAEDAAALATFFSENNRPEITSTFYPFPLDEENARRIATVPRRDRYFAAWEGKAIVGLGMLRGWDEGFAVPSFGVVVDHRAQGRGFGRALSEHALAVAREAGCERVRLTVHANREPVVRLYERAGFRRADELPDGRLVMIAELT
jgi:ribosomal protein S18 acetylase RimI-like enzyme